MKRVTGLRGRLTVALLAVSALTLAVTAVLLLAPLDRQLRNDTLTSLRQTARTAKPMFAAVDADGTAARNREFRTQAIVLRRRTKADVLVSAPDGTVLESTDIDRRGPTTDAVRAIRERRTVSSTISDEDGQAAQVTVPFRTADDQQYALTLRRSLTGVDAAQRVVRHALLVAGLIALVVALLAGLALAGRLVRRITALRDTTLRVAELGPVAEVHADDTRDEIGDLTRAFANMQQQLRDQEEARRTFVATASHELRTPLSSLLLMLHAATEDLDRCGPDVADARRQLAQAIEQAGRLTELSSTLLDLSRLDAGLPLRSELVELRELARSVVAELTQRAAERGTPVRLSGSEPIWVVADPGSVAQVVRILVDNALRHAGPAGPIDVEVSVEDGHPQLVVRDHGPGVEPADAEHVFERFRRGPSAGSEAGSGLGLAIGRELARRMGGDLRLVPDGPGARFVLVLAAAPAADSA